MSVIVIPVFAHLPEDWQTAGVSNKSRLLSSVLFTELPSKIAISLAVVPFFVEGMTFCDFVREAAKIKVTF